MRRLTSLIRSSIPIAVFLVVMASVLGAQVTTSSPPEITRQPVDVEVVEGDNAFLVVMATPSSNLQVAWFFNGVLLRAEGFTALRFEPADFSHAGKYYAVLTNSAGSVRTNEVTVTVLPPRKPAMAQVTRESALLGSRATLYMPSSLYRLPAGTTLQWYKDGKAVPYGTEPRLTIERVTTADAGDYALLVSNATGSTLSRVVHFTVLIPTGATGPLSVKRTGTRVYFSYRTPARVEVFDLAADAWLAPISLSAPPTALAASADGVFVATGRTVHRLAADGSIAAFGPTFNSDVTLLEVCGSHLVAHTIVSGRSAFTSVRIADGAERTTVRYPTEVWAEIIAIPGASRFLTRTHWDTAKQPHSITVRTDGTFATPVPSPRDGSFNPGTRLITSASLFADVTGMIYATSDLAFAGALGGEVDDVAFTDSGRIAALRGGVVHVYDRFTETGRMESGLTGNRIFAHGNDLFVFGSQPVDGTLPKVRLPIGSAKPPASADPLDARNHGFTPDLAFIDRRNVVHLVSKLSRHIFRWSASERRMLEPIALQNVPSHVTYAPATDRIYVGYGDARVTRIRRDAGLLAEEPFFTGLDRIDTLSAADEFIIISNTQRSTTQDWTFVLDSSGAIKARSNQIDAPQDYQWAPNQRRLYWTMDSSMQLTYSVLTATGAFTGGKVWPYWLDTPHRATHPIRLSPDGGRVLVGTGRLYDASTLANIGQLANGLDDSVWTNAALFTARTRGATTELQRWSASTWALEQTRTLPGQLLRIFAVGDTQLLAVTLRSGLTYLTLLGANLNEIENDFVGVPDRLANISCRTVAGSGDRALIAGFVVQGSHEKTVLVRAAGPALAAFGVSGVIPDPQLVVRDSTGATVATNDNWSSAADAEEIARASSQIGAFPFQSSGLDAACLVNLRPGNYTVEVSGREGASGVALVETYDLSAKANEARLVNLSTRAWVGAGDEVLISGLVVDGGAPKRLLIRGVGPTLGTFGVQGAISNPKLQLYQGSRLIAVNDDWDDRWDAAPGRIATAAAGSVGAFSLPAGSQDSALVVTLHPGNYSVVMSGVDGSTGTGLIEVYEIPR